MAAPTIKAAIAALLLLVAGRASAGECLPQVRDGWIRLAPPGMAMPMLSGYARIENRCAKPVVVESARSAAFGEVSLHRTSVVEGMSRMRPVPALPIAAHGAVTLQPGGLHLMLMQATVPLEVGATVRVVFRLHDGRELRGDFVVRNATQ